MDVGVGFGQDVGVEGLQGLGGLGVGLWRRVVDQHCVDEGAHRDSLQPRGLVFREVCVLHSCR